MKTTVYIIVRNTEDSEFNSISSFQSVHLTLEGAELAVKKWSELFGFNEDDYEILVRVAE